MAKTNSGREQRRIVIVSGHPILRRGLLQVINVQKDLVAGEAGTTVEAAELFRRQAFDLLLIDLSPPNNVPLSAIRDFVSLCPRTPVLVVSTQDESIYAERVIRAGAHGYVMEEAGAAALLKALREVLAGRVFVSTQIVQVLAQNMAGPRRKTRQSPIEALSDREFEVFEQVAQGKSSTLISKTLHISPKTVDVHRSNIKHKLKLKTQGEMLRYAVRWLESKRPARQRLATGRSHFSPGKENP